MVNRLERVKDDVSCYPVDSLRLNARQHRNLNSLKAGFNHYDRALNSLEEFARQYKFFEDTVQNDEFNKTLSLENKTRLKKMDEQLRPIYDAYCKTAEDEK